MGNAEGMGGGKGGKAGVDGTLPRMEGAGRMGENRVNWQLIFEEERMREKENAARNKTGPKRPELADIDESDMAAMASAWAAKQQPSKKKRKKSKTAAPPGAPPDLPPPPTGLVPPPGPVPVMH